MQQSSCRGFEIFCLSPYSVRQNLQAVQYLSPEKSGFFCLKGEFVKVFKANNNYFPKLLNATIGSYCKSSAREPNFDTPSLSHSTHSRQINFILHKSKLLLKWVPVPSLFLSLLVPTSSLWWGHPSGSPVISRIRQHIQLKMRLFSWGGEIKFIFSLVILQISSSQKCTNATAIIKEMARTSRHVGKTAWPPVWGSCRFTVCWNDCVTLPLKQNVLRNKLQQP